MSPDRHTTPCQTAITEEVVMGLKNSLGRGVSCRMSLPLPQTNGAVFSDVIIVTVVHKLVFCGCGDPQA